MTTILNSPISSVSYAGINTWNSNLIHLAQQGSTRLRPWVQEKRKGTTHDFFTRIAERSAIAEKTDLRTSTPDNAPTLSNRVAIPATYHDAAMLDPEEVARVLIDPKSGILHSMAMGFARQIDDLIIAAATAAALTDDASTTSSFPAGQGVGGATTDFDFDLVNSVNTLFLENDIDPEVEKCFVISPNCVEKMLAMDEATSSDYVNARALASAGYVKSWMGFTFIVSNRLTDPAATSYQRYGLAFTRQAMGMLVEKDISTEVNQRPDKCNNWQVYSAMTMGCVRVQDEHIVRVHFLES